MTTYIADIAHYNEVLARVASVRHSLVIGTADIKDLYVKVGVGREPFLAVLDLLVRRGVEVLAPKKLIAKVCEEGIAEHTQPNSEYKFKVY